MNILKWLLGGFLGGFLVAGCASQQMLQYKSEQMWSDPPPQHLPSLWCEMQDKMYHRPCIEPKEARK